MLLGYAAAKATIRPRRRMSLAISDCAFLGLKSKVLFKVSTLSRFDICLKIFGNRTFELMVGME